MRTKTLGPWMLPWLLACGPDTVTSDGTEDGSGDAATSGASGSTAIGADETGTTSADTSTGEVPEASWCLRGAWQPQIEATDLILSVHDGDGDGRDEVWAGREQWDPVTELQSTRLLGLQLLDDDELLDPVVDLEIEGEVMHMADVDGDGMRDLLLAQWSEPQPWWQAGLPDGTFDATRQPLSPPSSSRLWVDADGDGAVDVFDVISGEMGAIDLYLGDGTGSFAPTDQLPAPEAVTYTGIVQVWPSELPGRHVAFFREETIGFGSNTDVVMGIEVSAAGEISIVAQSDPLEVGLRHASDLDDDGVPDAIGLDEKFNQWVMVLRQDAPGQYAPELIEGDVHGLVVGPLVAEGPDLLYWDSGEGMWLRQRVDGDWPDAAPVTIEGPWARSNQTRMLEADGTPGAEILVRLYQGSWEGYSLWRVEPC